MPAVKAVQIIIAMIGVLWLGIAGAYGAFWYDHHFQGWQYTIRIPLLFHYTFVQPLPAIGAGVAVRDARDLAAARAALVAAVGQQRACVGLLDTQSAMARTVEARGHVARAQAEASIRPQLAAIAAAPAKRAQIAAALDHTPAEAEDCVQYRTVYKVVEGTLK